MKINKKIIKELSDYLDEFNLTELEYTEKDTKIKVSKNNISINNQNLPSVKNDSSSTETVKVSKSNSANSNQVIGVKTNAPQANDETKSKLNLGIEITSPIIGTAYHAPEPGAKKFIEIGKKIKKGDTIMIVEAMKTMNHVPSTADGTIKEICVEDGQPVEFGQTIVILD